VEDFSEICRGDFFFAGKKQSVEKQAVKRRKSAFRTVFCAASETSLLNMVRQKLKIEA